MHRNFPNAAFPFVSLASVAMLMMTSLCYGQATEEQQQFLAAAPVASVPLQVGVPIHAANSRISFVGTHVGDDPKPRLGGFSDFHGFVSVDPSGRQIKAIEVDIKIGSVWTEFNKLTMHLQNADFFDVQKFGRARFVSTGVESTGDGKCTVTGNLTLHGQTKPLSFPAVYQIQDGRLILAAKFNLDRSQFGMDQMLGGVERSVYIDVVVGQATKIPTAKDGHGGDENKSQSNNPSNNATQKVSINVPNML